MTRKYELKKRAERQAETRQRIVEAAVALHSSVGPSQTSISAIAEYAGVQRHTVYAHFPDDASLFAACTHHWAEAHPFPDASRWAAIDDPRKRLAGALTDVYRWYGEVGDDIEVFLRDAELVPLAGAEMQSYASRLDELADRLAAPLGRSRALRAAVGHALAFETWRSLVRREGLTPVQAVTAMLAFVENV